MSGDVYVKFQADTGELEGAFALARAQTQAWQREMAATAREITRTGATMDLSLGVTSTRSVRASPPGSVRWRSSGPRCTASRPGKAR